MSAAKRFALRLIECLGGFNLLQWKNKNRPLILMYHRVIDDPLVNGLAPQVFEQQIAYIAKHFRIVPIETLLNQLATNTLQPSTLALTFDDGHFDFYENAWPVLKKYKAPASLYITTGFVDGTHWLWPDLLKYILDNNRKAELTLPDIGTLPTTEGNLQDSWHKLGDYCLTLDVQHRNHFLSTLAAVAEVNIPASPLKPFSAVTWPQLQEMQKEGLTVGSHTVSHPILSSLNEQDLRYELEYSAQEIKEKLGEFPHGICYPNGRPEDINPNVIECAKKLGYSYGLMGRKMPINKERKFLIGRLAANKNFDYFKWTLSRRQSDISDTYLQ